MRSALMQWAAVSTQPAATSVPPHLWAMSHPSRPDSIYNGADDNASGVAAVLAVAQAFADDPPRHDILIALVDAEEGGLRGSRVLVAAPPVPRERVAMAVNFDMLGRSAKNELYVAGGAHFPWLKPRLEALAVKAIKETVEHGVIALAGLKRMRKTRLVSAFEEYCVAYFRKLGSAL